MPAKSGPAKAVTRKPVPVPTRSEVRRVYATFAKTRQAQGMRRHQLYGEVLRKVQRSAVHGAFLANSTTGTIEKIVLGASSNPKKRGRPLQLDTVIQRVREEVSALQERGLAFPARFLGFIVRSRACAEPRVFRSLPLDHLHELRPTRVYLQLSFSTS